MPKYNGLFPFFCYYGGKWRIAKRYPEPLHPHVIEPFAGAAGYSLRHYELNVTLYDVDPAVYGIWDYLIKTPAEEIRKLPSVVSHVDDCSGPQEAKWLIGFWLNKATATPHLTPSAWMRSGIRPNSYWGDVIKERIATQVEKIRHWRVINKSYEEADDVPATWFIDPPYQGACGQRYRYKLDEYKKLGDWCRNRQGQVIVCEKAGADWLPFRPFHKIKTTPGSRGKSYSEEVLWTTPPKLDEERPPS